MRKLILTIFAVLAITTMAMAQNTGQTPTPPAPGTLPTGLSDNNFNVALGQDILGAHNGYGRGCVMCHAPHGGAAGNGATTTDTYNGTYALWGENLGPYYGLTFTFAGGAAITLPTGAQLSTAGAERGVLECLSCHDGNLAQAGMMKGQTVEMLPVVGGTAPTLFGTTPGNSGQSYNNEHPVGPDANVGCTTDGSDTHGWDCSKGTDSKGNTVILMNGTASKAFLTNYPGSFWNKTGNPPNPLTSFNGSTVKTAVTCTTCHGQHTMTAYTNSKGSFATMFFIKGNYMPSTGGNSVAQFCRNCHGGESNEMNGLLNVPTT